MALFKASRARRFPISFASVGTNIGRCSLAPKLKAISFVTDQRPNILMPIAVCIALTLMFAVAMAVHAVHQQPFPHRASLEEVALSGSSGVLDCDKVFNNGNCCVALHCAFGIAPRAASPAFRQLSSKAIAEAPESLPSRVIGRLERPPKQSFSA